MINGIAKNKSLLDIIITDIAIMRDRIEQETGRPAALKVLMAPRVWSALVESPDTVVPVTFRGADNISIHGTPIEITPAEQFYRVVDEMNPLMRID